MAQAEVEKLGKTYQAQIQDSLKELDAKLKQYNAEAEAQTQEENQRRMEEVEGMKQSLAQFQQNAQQSTHTQCVCSFSKAFVSFVSFSHSFAPCPCFFF